MTPQDFIASVNEDPENNSFSRTIEVIDENFQFTPTPFKNGNLENAANQNNGSCKIFAFAQIYQLEKDLTLACFGEIYFEEVLGDPLGKGHQNIRNFMKTGWDGIQFNGTALRKK